MSVSTHSEVDVECAECLDILLGQVEVSHRQVLDQTIVAVGLGDYRETPLESPAKKDLSGSWEHDSSVSV